MCVVTESWAEHRVRWMVVGWVPESRQDGSRWIIGEAMHSKRGAGCAGME